jgi:hypothetical protein
MKYHYVTNTIQLQLYHYQLYIHQHVIKVITTYWWTHDMVTNEKIGLDEGLLKLESSMHILFKFFWHKQWHGIHVFHFLNILKSFDRCDIYIEYIQVLFYCNCNLIATLTLGSQPRQGLAKVHAKKEARESHFMLPGVLESVKEWTLTLPSQLPLWELESQWTPESSESNYKGQNPLNCKVFYIIGKLLELRCLKWACMTHLDTSNTSYGQKKGQQSNCQFDSQPLKVKNRPQFSYV